MLCLFSFKIKGGKSKSRLFLVYKQPRDSIWLRGLLSCVISWKVKALMVEGLSVTLTSVSMVGVSRSLSLSPSVSLSLSFRSHLVTAPIDLVKMTKWGNNMRRRPACSSVPSLLLPASSAPPPTAVGHWA